MFIPHTKDKIIGNPSVNQVYGILDSYTKYDTVNKVCFVYLNSYIGFTFFF